MSQSSDPHRPHHLTNFEAIRIFYERSANNAKFGPFEMSFLQYFALTRLLDVQNADIEEAKTILDKYPFTVEDKVQILNFFPQSIEELESLAPNCPKYTTLEQRTEVIDHLTRLYTSSTEDTS